MATVERRRQERSDGTLGPVSYRVRWRDPDGRQRSRSFSRRRDADKWLTKVEHDKLAGTYVDARAGQTTVQAYGERWRQAQMWAPGTAERVEITMRLHVYPTFGSRALASIRRTEVQAWVKALSESKAAATVGVAAVYLSSMMSSAVKDRLIAHSPCEDIDLPRVRRKEVVPPTPAQVELLARTVPVEWRALVAVGAGLGLRVGEALGLTLDHVDWLGRQVRVDQQAQPRNGGVVLEPLKSDAAVRTVPLPESTGQALTAHVERFGLGKGEALFAGRRGALVRRQRVAEVVASAVQRSKGQLPAGLRFHDLRHFYASLLIASGASVKTVQRRLGHASAVETLDVYGHLWPDSEEQTRSAVDAVLAPFVTSMCPEVEVKTPLAS